MTWADLKEYFQFNRDFVSDMQAAIKAGKTREEVAASWKIPAKYVGYAPPVANRLQDNVALADQEFGKK